MYTQWTCGIYFFVITEQNRTEFLFVKTCTYIHHHTKHLIQLYTRDIQL